MEEVITELKHLRPEQVDEVGRIVHLLAQAKCETAPRNPLVPACVVDEAVQHGWPAELFNALIGGLPELGRATQPPAERRSDL